MAITQEMKNVVRDIKIETISDFGTFQELESFAKELLSSNDTGNKLLALRIQNRLNENPNYQTFINRQKIEEAQITEQKEKEIDKTQHLRQQNATVNVENRKRTENNEKIKENERKLLDSINYKNVQNIKFFLETEFNNLSLSGSVEFLENINKSLKEEKDPQKREEMAHEITDSGSTKSKFFNRIDNKIIPFKDDSKDILEEKIKLKKEANTIANFASPHPKTSAEFLEDYKKSLKEEALLETWNKLEQIPNYKTEYKQYFNEKGEFDLNNKNIPEEAKEWHRNNFSIELQKKYFDIIKYREQELIENGHTPSKIITNEINNNVKNDVEKISALFDKNNNYKQQDLNSGEQIKNILYTIKDFDMQDKAKVLDQVFASMNDDKNFHTLIKYHKTEINQMLLSKDDNIDSVAKDNFIRELYETENHYALKVFLSSFPNNEFGNEKSVDIIIQKLGEQYQQIDRIEEKAKQYLNGQDINEIDFKNIDDLEIERYIKLQKSISEKEIKTLDTDKHDVLTASLAETYNKYFENPQDIDKYIEKNKNNSSFFNEQELRQLQEVSRAEFYTLLRNLVIEKMKSDPECDKKNYENPNEWSIAQYLIEHDKNFVNSEYGKNAIKNTKDKTEHLENVKEVNYNQVYNPTVRGQGQTEGVAYEAQVLIEKNYRVMPNDTQVFVPNGNTGFI